MWSGIHGIHITHGIHGIQITHITHKTSRTQLPYRIAITLTIMERIHLYLFLTAATPTTLHISVLHPIARLQEVKNYNAQGYPPQSFYFLDLA